jgi:hypothetical protein
MVVLRSGNTYIKSEPEESSSDLELSSAVIVSVTLSPPPETPIETCPLCLCGNPVREKMCMGLRNSADAGRIMYLCPLPKECPYFQWKDEVNRLGPSPETDIKQEPDGNGTTKREVTPAVDSTILTPPTSPHERPPVPTGKYICWCDPPRPATRNFYSNGTPDDINKYYYTCPVCFYWRRIESEADAMERINKRKQGLGYQVYDVIVKCGCGEVAAWLVSRTTQNPGRAFYRCETSGCGDWAWEDKLFAPSIVGRRDAQQHYLYI